MHTALAAWLCVAVLCGAIQVTRRIHPEFLVDLAVSYLPWHLGVGLTAAPFLLWGRL